MKVHRHLGHAFAAFCTYLLCWHSTTPQNPQHDVAMVSMSTWAVLFLISAWSSVRVARLIQPSTLLVGAFLTVHFGNLPIAAIIVVIAVLVYWAYGEFLQFDPVQATWVFTLVFVIFFSGIATSGYGYGSAFFLALAWTMASLMGFCVLWAIFVAWAGSLIRQNREVLEDNKLLKGGRSDGQKRR